jgi:hypothetical protein
MLALILMLITGGSLKMMLNWAVLAISPFLDEESTMNYFSGNN